MPDTLTPTRLSSVADISVPYASQILNGKRPWTRRIALAVYRDTQRKVGPISKATDEQIRVLLQFEGQRA